MLQIPKYLNIMFINLILRHYLLKCVGSSSDHTSFINYNSWMEKFRVLVIYELRWIRIWAIWKSAIRLSGKY